MSLVWADHADASWHAWSSGQSAFRVALRLDDVEGLRHPLVRPGPRGAEVLEHARERVEPGVREPCVQTALLADLPSDNRWRRRRSSGSSSARCRAAVTSPFAPIRHQIRDSACHEPAPALSSWPCGTTARAHDTKLLTTSGLLRCVTSQVSRRQRVGVRDCHEISSLTLGAA